MACELYINKIKYIIFSEYFSFGIWFILDTKNVYFENDKTLACKVKFKVKMYKNKQARFHK